MKFYRFAASESDGVEWTFCAVGDDKQLDLLCGLAILVCQFALQLILSCLVNLQVESTGAQGPSNMHTRASILEGKAQPLTSSKWRDVLRGVNLSCHLKVFAEQTAHQFITNSLCV